MTVHGKFWEGLVRAPELHHRDSAVKDLRLDVHLGFQRVKSLLGILDDYGQFILLLKSPGKIQPVSR